MKIVLGIGNPGEKYEETRHNVGWWVVEALAGEMEARFRKAGFEFWAAEGRLGRREVVLVKTWTYVNETGRAIPEIVGRFGEDLLVVCDDVDLPVGRLRIRKGGSSGGHRGLQSVLDAFGHEAVARLRIGIGGGRRDPDYVLGKFGKEERVLIEETVKTACAAVRCWVEEGIEKCMTKFNRRTGREDL